MPDKSPELWGVATWLLAIGTSLCGGMLNFIKSGGSDLPLHTRIRDALVELATSGFVGTLVFMGLAGMGWDSTICAAGCGVSAHFSARLLAYAAHYMDALFEAKHRHLHKEIDDHDDD